MRRRSLLALVLAAGLLGFALGWFTRTAARKGPDRPAPVEQALRALDAYERRGGDPAALREALASAGVPSSYRSPWREELDLVRLVAKDDPEALWRFATDRPPAAPRARALAWLAARAPTPAERDRALERLREDYPTSWVLGPSAAGPR